MNLRDTEGAAGYANSSVLGELIAYVGTLPEPWIIAGDLNLPPEELTSTNVFQVVRGVPLHPGEPTLVLRGQWLRAFAGMRSWKFGQRPTRSSFSRSR